MLEGKTLVFKLPWTLLVCFNVYIHRHIDMSTYFVYFHSIFLFLVIAPKFFKPKWYVVLYIMR